MLIVVASSGSRDRKTHIASDSAPTAGRHFSAMTAIIQRCRLGVESSLADASFGQPPASKVVKSRIGKGLRSVISFRQLPHKLAGTNRKKWLWIGLAAVPAIHFYYVQEMIAALIIFSVLFVGAATAVLIIFLLDRASRHIIAWAEPYIARMVHSVADAVGGIIASPVWAHAVPHRFRREQLKENEKN